MEFQGIHVRSTQIVTKDIVMTKSVFAYMALPTKKTAQLVDVSMIPKEF